jgi:hypothetical protein
MRSSGPAAVLAALALGAPAAAVAVDGPVTRLATVGGRPDVIARADGSAVAVWEEKPAASTSNVHFCRLAAGAGTCTAGSEKTLTSVAGATTSRPFVFDLSGGRIVVVHGGCCAQHTYRWISGDGGATFGTQADFASLVPVDQGAAAGPGDTISLVGDPVTGTVGYQLANPAAAKTTQEATLDGAAGLTFAQAVSVDPATGRPYAMWASSTDAFFSTATGANVNLTASWAAPGKLAGVSGMRLAGALATWLRDGRHEVARWTGGGFSAAQALPFAPAGAGEADIATDPAGGVHVVFTPSGSGNVCYVYAPDGTTFGAPRLLGRDTGGVAGLQVSATGASAGRVVFSGPTSAGPVSVLPLGAATLTPNSCGLAPAGLVLVKALAGDVVNVAVDPSGQDTAFHVDYGPTAAYGASTADQTVTAAAGPAAAAVGLGPLAPATTYHARLVATNATGVTIGADVAFTTPPTLARVRAGDLIGVPWRCAKRRLRIDFPERDGIVPAAAVIRATGHRTLRLGARRLAARTVVLTSLARRGVRLSIALKLADGRIVRTSRTYARCSR